MPNATRMLVVLLVLVGSCPGDSPRPARRDIQQPAPTGSPWVDLPAGPDDVDSRVGPISSGK
ncbi:MAG TPA: hypothetical protein VFV87_04070 [Pirellulaceae bacterium]|nr:hypothetical protein [Pirellulaceae bacterium]